MSSGSRPEPSDPSLAIGATRTNVGIPALQAQDSLFAGRYRIVKLLGIGGMGMVYQAFDEQLELPVALKLLRPERASDQATRDRFRQELILARQVSHRNVVRIHDLGQEGDTYFLTMDFIEGRSLQKVLQEEGPLPPERVLALGRQLAGALTAAHREGVVHRDLKPANVMVDAADRAFVTDFGIASSASVAGLTATGSVVGTPDYLSPEQARGEPADPRSDLYALGLILFEMATGRLPFPGGSLSEVLAQRAFGRPWLLREVAAEAGAEAPPGLAAIIDRCLENDITSRYQSAEALAADLKSGQTRPGFRLRIPARVRRVSAILAASALLLGLVAAALFRAGSLRDTTGPLHTIAVLPLVDETGRADLGWVSKGFAELAAGELAENPELQVVGGLRTFRTLDDLGIESASATEADLRLVAELLDVDRLVTGHVRASGNGIRIDARLLSVGPERMPSQLFSVESAGGDETIDLVARLVTELRRRLEVGDKPAAGTPAPGGSDLRAGIAYGEGLVALARGDPVSAAEAFEQALVHAPRFPAASAHLAAVSTELGFTDRALELTRNALAQTLRGGRLELRLEAREALLAGKREVAVARFEELVERYPNDVSDRLELAGILGAAGRMAEASEALRDITERDPHHPEAWYLLGKFSILQGESRRAVDEYLTRALVIHNRLDNLRGQGEVLNAFGVAYQKLGALDDAERRYREAAEIRRRTGDLRGHSASLFNLAIIHAQFGDFDAARRDLDQVIEVRQQIGDHAGLASAQNHLGHLEEQRGRFREARAHFAEGLRGRRKLGDPRAVAESLNNVGFMDFLLGRPEQTLEHLSEARELYRQIGNPEGEAVVEQSLARVDLASGEWSTALGALLGSLEASRANGRRDAEAVALTLLGRVAQMQGRFRAAVSSFGEALEIFTELGDRRALADVMLRRTDLYLDLGKIDAAGEEIDRLQSLVEAGDALGQRADLQWLRGRRLLRLGDVETAANRFAEARDLAVRSGSLRAELWARLGAAEAAAEAGPRGEARQELSSIARESVRIDDVRLRWYSALILGRELRRSGDLDEAEIEARKALDLFADRAPLAGAHHLHLLLAEVLADLGRPAEAEAELSRAAAELTRIRQSLDDSERAAFDRLPEVQRIVRESAAG